MERRLTAAEQLEDLIQIHKLFARLLSSTNPRLSQITIPKIPPIPKEAYPAVLERLIFVCSVKSQWSSTGELDGKLYPLAYTFSFLSLGPGRFSQPQSPLRLIWRVALADHTLP